MGCSDRHQGCHAECDSYSQYKSVIEARRAYESAQRDLNAIQGEKKSRQVRYRQLTNAGK